MLDFSIADVVYFKRISSGSCTSISQSAALSMYWVNILLLIVAIILFLWALYRLIFGRETREKILSQRDKLTEQLLSTGGLYSTTPSSITSKNPSVGSNLASQSNL